MLCFLRRLVITALMWLVIPAAPVWAQSVRVPDDFDTIQEAIDAIARNPLRGDTVRVEPGTYTENLILISDITIRGEETARTILEADFRLDPIVSATNVTNTVFRNFTLKDSDVGIRVERSTDITIISNVFDLDTDGTGIEVVDDSTVDVINNTFFDNAVAVSRTSDRVNIQNNIFSENTLAIRSDGISGGISFNCFNDNDIDGQQGTSRVTDSDARFVDPSLRDFHLRQGSPCIDEGTGTDVIDDSDADLGAYGGDVADAFPFPVQDIAASDISDDVGTPSIRVTWSANESYLVTNDSNPGSYNVFYDSDASGSPYEGQDAGGGSQPSPIDAGNVTEFRLTDLSPDSGAPSAPAITSVGPENTQITFTWSEVAGASNYNVHYGVSSVNENQIDVGNVTSHTLTGLENGVTYTIAVSAVAQTTYYLNVTAVDNTGESDHESAFGTEVSVPLGEAQESALSETITAIPEEVVPFPLLENKGCFIATAAYGFYDAPQVQVLRDFRDQYLLSHVAGRWFVDWYYANSPAAAHYLETHPQWKPLVRALLMPLVVFALFVTQASSAVKVLVGLLLGVSVGLLWHHRRQPKHLSGAR